LPLVTLHPDTSTSWMTVVTAGVWFRFQGIRFRFRVYIFLRLAG